jgi:hypothetical protein
MLCALSCHGYYLSAADFVSRQIAGGNQPKELFYYKQLPDEKWPRM